MSNRILILGGTTEGRILGEALAKRGCDITVSVATDYGAELLQDIPVSVVVGRMDEEKMTAYFPAYDQVIDATHPYAVAASHNAKRAAQRCGIPYRRLLRPEEEEKVWWQSVPDIPGAVAALQKRDGNILLTTGSKELQAFTALPDYQERLWVRILASQDSLALALAAGFRSSHIIAMQGPFSTELNMALFHQFQIQTLVTKRSGKAGGFAEKVEAARRTGTALLVVERPEQETGESLEEILQSFEKEVKNR